MPVHQRRSDVPPVADQPAGEGGRSPRRNLVKLGVGGVAAGLLAAGAEPAHAEPDPDITAAWARAAVNVLDAGARGDGKTNDAPAFQDALDQLAGLGGGTLIIPPGTYLLNNRVQLRDNVFIHSPGAVLTKSAGAHSYFVSLSGDKQGYGSGVRNVKVEGLTFQGDFVAPFVACGFALHHAQNVVVENCHFLQNQGVGHCMDLCGCERITVRNCTFTGFYNFKGTPGYNKEETIQLDQSRKGALSFPDADASYDALFTRDVIVENCRFLPVSVQGKLFPCGNPIGAHAPREGHWYTNITFRGNLVVDPTADPATTENDTTNGPHDWRGVTHFPTVKGLRIEDNTYLQHHPRPNRVITVFSTALANLDSVPPDQRPTTGPVDPMASADIFITGNTIIGFSPDSGGPTQEAIWLRGVAGGEIRNVTIRDNTISGGRNDKGEGAVAIAATHATRLHICDNNIASYVGGVALSNTTHFHVTHNDILAGDGPQPQAGCSIGAGCSDGIVSGNITTGYDHPVRTTGSSPHVRTTDNL